MRGALLAAVLPLAALAVAPTAQAAPGFTAEARALGLNAEQAASLQARADDYLAKLGGRQVAANKIALSGADVYLTLPGERTARTASAACAYGHMCAYQSTYYYGDVIDMYVCNDYGIPWVNNGSWINNQTTGTKAKFKDNAGNVGWISPGAYTSDGNAPWSWVYSVKNC
ncbi:hypothetical protein Acsp05_09070 [Actinokineospora sp. NBRC 105648]|nr:hypothetical protein Acsp05_09070 [Actinokineospora sp. NBRC 105648]